MRVMYSVDQRARQEIEERYRREDKVSAPLRVKAVDGGMVLPGRNRAGGVLDDTGDFVEASAYACRGVRLWGGSYKVSGDETERREETVIFAGQMQRHWGNFLFDCLARMWYPLREKEYRIVYCSLDLPEEELKDPGKNYSQLLALMGISPERVEEIKRPTVFERVLIPELAVFPGEFYSEELRGIYDNIVSNVTGKYGYPVYDRIYLTRTHMKVKKELGEESIERLFAENGYRVIAPETLSVAEQVWLFSHCRVFASMEGTTSHNIVFAKPGAEQIILRKQSYINTRQILFNKMKEIDPVYIDVFYEPYRGFPLSHDSGPFWVGVTGRLARWAGEEGMACRCASGGRIGDIIVFGGNFLLYSVKCLYYKYVLRR